MPPVDEEVERRIAENQARFREVNEAISRGQWPGEADGVVGFRCECAALGCNQLIEVTPSGYENVRAHPRRFIVLPGHERAEIERVVERRTGYLVVEKTEEAGERAEETDPRS
ncbi:MAG TPA: hypothetical protein VG186_00625 [Solirubrobacteraceae bacterium]|jgi:hypothetical protein|nr:hypothetical protein [Solirubrobacteraceae bacterium]